MNNATPANALGRILVVDDDHALCDLLIEFLGRHGFEVRALSDGASIERELNRHTPDLIVLDVMLPGEDGMAICRRLRGQGRHIPIIMLTGRGDEVDRIVGLEMGADDYLGKPFNPRELLARIVAVLRRSGLKPVDSTGVAQFGPFRLDVARRELTRDGVVLPLTAGEFELLRVLIEHAGRPMNRDQLLDLTRGRDYDAVDRTVDVQISKLRRVIEEDSSNPRYIKTIWGFGYVFVSAPES